MGKETIEGIITVCVAIVGLGIVATLVSRNANTAGILTAGGGALATGISAAEAPVTGGGGYQIGSVGWTGSAPLDLPSY